MQSSLPVLNLELILKNKPEHITVVSPSLKMGGIERALVVLSNFFIKKEIEVTFISCLRNEPFYKLDHRIRFIEPDFDRKKSLLNALCFYPKLLLFIRREVKKVKPDVVLAFGDWFSPMVLLALLRTGIPVYISDRTSPEFKLKFPIPLLKRILYPRSAGFIAQTGRAAGYKETVFNGKLNIRIIPNALREVSLYPELSREKIILYAGRLSWEKGPDRLLKAFSMITERKNWELWFAGSGPYLAKMNDLAYELKINEEVCFLGKVEDIDRLYAKAGIFVLPSLVEGFPNALCEAMNAGLPVICFDSIPFEELFTPGKSGMVVKDNDIKELAATIEMLINDEGKRISLGAEARLVSKSFEVDRIGEDVLNFIGE